MIRVATTLLLLLNLCVSSTVFAEDATQPKPNTLVKFLAMGDLPYAKTEYDLLRKQLADIIDFLPYPISVVDINEKIIAWNRAMVEINEEHRLVLKPEGLMTRDPRMVERKKFGQKKARKKFQFSKR